jgi:hypothetical protein
MCTSQRATSCDPYKHRSRLIDISITIESIQLLFIIVFTLGFYFSFLFCRLDFLATVSTPWVAVVQVSSLSRYYLTGGEAPHQSTVTLLTTIGPDKIESSSLSNRSIRFLQFKLRLLVPVHFV